MKRFRVLIGAAACVTAVCGSVRADCRPVTADIVSLGEKAARFYAQRSLDKGVEEETRSLESTGAKVGKITKAPLECKFFPNVIGMDEWRCTGSAKVCTKI